MIRGEFSGDLKNVSNPIVMGVWKAKDRQDLYNKLSLIRKGAGQFLTMGLNGEKRLTFYNTTYNSCDVDLDIFKTVTLHEMATMKDEDFGTLTREVDNEMSDLIFAAG